MTFGPRSHNDRLENCAYFDYVGHVMSQPLMRPEEPELLGPPVDTYHFLIDYFIKINKLQ